MTCKVLTTTKGEIGRLDISPAGFINWFHQLVTNQNKLRAILFQAYTAWVNSQLRKRPGLQLIQDIGNDLQDGVRVAHLIEIISKSLNIHTKKS